MKKMKLIAFAVISAVFISACGGGESSTSTDVPFTTIAQTLFSSSVSVSEGLVARSQSEFNAMWARTYTRISPPPQQPSIDFNAVQVIGYFLAARPTGCYSVSIVRISQQADRLLVTYKEAVPPPTAICTAAGVFPAHLVTVPKSQLEVVFVSE